MKGKLKNRRIALGLITRHFDDPDPIFLFLDNASEHGHVIDRVIVAYSHSKDESTITAVNNRIKLDH
jgi:hypothetical protein